MAALSMSVIMTLSGIPTQAISEALEEVQATTQENQEQAVQAQQEPEQTTPDPQESDATPEAPESTATQSEGAGTEGDAGPPADQAQDDPTQDAAAQSDQTPGEDVEGEATSEDSAPTAEQTEGEQAATQTDVPVTDESKPTEEQAANKTDDATAPMPAFDQSKTVDGVKVTVQAEEGTFPEAAQLSVTKVSAAVEEKVADAVDEVRDTSREVAASYTFDIKVLDKDGKEVQPADENKVKVSFKTEEVTEKICQTEVYHIEDATAKKPEVEQLDVTEKGDVATAETDGFSTYTIVFSYESKTYTIDADTSATSKTVTLQQIFDEFDIRGLVFNVRVEDADPSGVVSVAYTGSETNVGGTGGPATNASDWKITSGAISGMARLVVSLYNRPTYFFTVVVNGQESGTHQVILRHMDGKEVTSDNPARYSEVLEVYVTGYTDTERKNLYYSYAKGDSGDGNYQCSSTPSLSNIWISFTSMETPLRGYRFIVASANNTEIKYAITPDSDGKVNIGLGTADAQGYKTKQLNLGATNLQKDLNDVARTLHPVIIRKGETSPNLIDQLNDKGIAHLTGCSGTPKPTLTASVPANSGLTVTSVDLSTTVKGSKYGGPYNVVFTLSKNGCTFHKNASGTIPFDVYVLNVVYGEQVDNAIKLTDTNEWCSYTLKKTVDGTTTELGTYTYAQLQSMNNLLPLSGKGEYVVEETVTGIDFLAEDDKVAVKVKGQNGSDLSVQITHEHTWNYSANGATITATCVGNTDDPVCSPAASSTLTVVAPNSDSLVYDGQPKAATLSITDEEGAFTATVDDIEYYQGDNKLTSAPTDAGSYTAKVTVGGQTASVGYTITKAQKQDINIDSLENAKKPSVTTGLVYDGSEQLLITAPTSYPTNYDGIMYQVDGGAWTTDAPSATDAGTHTIKFKYTSNNYADSDEFTLTGAGIAKRPVTVTGITAQDKKYDGNTDATVVLDGATVGGVAGNNNSGVVSGQTLTVSSATGTFDTNAVGENKTVTITNVVLVGTTKDNYEITSVDTAKARILKADAPALITEGENSQAPTAVSGLAYTGSNQNLVVKPNGNPPDGYGTIQYSTDGGTTWSADLPQGKDAQAYPVQYKYVSATHADITGTLGDVTIGKGTNVITVTVANAETWTYNDSASDHAVTYEGTLSGTTGGTVKYQKKNDQGSYEDMQGTPTEAGDYKAVVEVPADGNNYDAATGETAFTIAPLAFVDDTVAGYEPKAGDYRVDVKVNGKATDSVTYSGSTQRPTVTVQPQRYDGTNWVNVDSPTITADDYTVTVKDSKGVTVATEGDNAGPKDADTYTITVAMKETSNFAGSKDVAYTITAANASVSAPTAVSPAPVYAGTPAQLINAGSSNDGTVKYLAVKSDTQPETAPATTDDGWLADATQVTGTAAGDYYVYYYVAGDDNHNDTAVAGPIKVTINKATLDPTSMPAGSQPTAKTGENALVYTADAQDLVTAPAPASVPTGYKLQYKFAAAGDDKWSDNVPQATNAGDYAVVYKYVPVDDDAAQNYSEVTSNSFSISTNIAPASLEDAVVVASPSSFEFDGTTKTPTSVTVTINNHEIPASDYEVVCSNNTNKGTATVTVSPKSGNLVAGKTATTNFSITAKVVNPADVVVSAGDGDANDLTKQVYDGTEKKPSPTIKIGDKTLVEGTDYDLVYPEDVINAGEKTVTISFKGDYAAAVDGEGNVQTSTFAYTIQQRPITVKANAQVVSEGVAISSTPADVTVTSDLGLVGTAAISDVTLAASTEQGGSIGTITITEGSVVIKDGNTDVTNNYAITYDNSGKLTIKAAQTAPSDDDKSNLINAQTTTSITINTTPGYEYVITTSQDAPTDEAAWAAMAQDANPKLNDGYYKENGATASTHTFDGLEVGTAYYVHMRKAGVEPTDTDAGKDPSPAVTVPTSTKPAALDPNVEGGLIVIDYVNETVSPKDATNELRVKTADNSNTYSSNATSINPNTAVTIEVRIAEKDGVAASDPVEVTIPQRPTATAATIQAKSDTSVLLGATTIGQQYVVVPATATEDQIEAAWTSNAVYVGTGETHEFSGLTQDTAYKVVTRVPAVATTTEHAGSFKSLNVITEVTTKRSAPDDDVTGGMVTEQTQNSITIDAKQGYEYVVTTSENAPTDDAVWSDTGNNAGYYKPNADGSHTFTPLDPGTKYYVHVRAAATTDPAKEPSLPTTVPTSTRMENVTPTEGTSHSFDYEAETVTAGDGYQIRRKGGSDDDWATGPLTFAPGEEFEVKKLGENGAADSVPAEFTAPTRADAPASATTEPKDNTSFTIKNSGSGQEYVVLPKKNNGEYTQAEIEAAFKAAVVDQTKRIEGNGADIAVSKDSNGNSLVAGTEYVVYNRVAAVTESEPQSIASKYAGPVEAKTKTNPANLTGDEKSAIKSGTWDSSTANPATIMVNGKAGYEYLVLPASADVAKADWTRATKFNEDGTKVFSKDSAGDKITSNTDYVILARKSATDEAMPSNPVEVPAYTTQKAPAAREGYTVDYPGETVTAADGYEVRKKGTDEWTTSTEAEPGATYEVRKKATTEGEPPVVTVTSHESTPTEFTLSNRPKATSAPAATTTDTAITIEPTTKGQQYVVVAKGTPPTDADWAQAQTSKDGEKITFTGLDPDTEYVVVTRVPATDHSFASKNADPTSATTKRSAPEVSEQNLIKDQADTTITINTTKGCEYVLSESPNPPAGDWSTGSAADHYYAETQNETGTHTFGANPEQPLEAGKKYYVHVREAATDNPAKEPSLPTTVPTSTRVEIGDDEGYTFDYNNETVTAEEGYKIRRKGEGDDKWVDGPLDFDPGELFEVKKLGEDGAADSAPEQFQAPSRPSAPPAVDNVDKTDVTITIKPTQKDEEYVVLPKKAGGEAYTADEIAEAFQNATPGTGSDMTFSKDSKGNDIQPGTDYVVYNRTQAVNEGENKVLASLPNGPTEVTTKTSTQPLTNDEKTALGTDTWNKNDAKAHSILVHGKEGYEYLVLPKPADAARADWSKATPFSAFDADGTKTFTSDSYGTAIKDNTNYEILARKAETDSSLPSEPVSVPAYTTQEKPGAGEGYNVDYPDEVITVENGYEIRAVKPAGTEPSNWTSGPSVPLTPGATYEIRKKEGYPEATDHESEPATFTVAERPDAPDLVDNIKPSDTTLTVQPSEKDQEYIVLPKKESGDYTPEELEQAFQKGAVPGTGNDLVFSTDADGTPLEADKDYVVYNRVIATDEAPHSNPTSNPTKTQASQNAPSTDDLVKGKTSTSITINTRPGVEYVVTTSEVPPTDEDWSKANTNGYYKETGSQPSTHKFGGLEEGTTYYVHSRKAEVSEPAPGAAPSPASTVATSTKNATPQGEPVVKQVNTSSVVIAGKKGEEYVILPAKADGSAYTTDELTQLISTMPAGAWTATGTYTDADITLSKEAGVNDLVPGSNYVVYGRTAATDTGAASDPSAPTAITMLKQNLNASDLKDANKPTPADKPVYSGAEQPLVSEPTTLPTGTTGVQYSTDGGKTWSDTVPTATDAGNYEVTVKYVGDALHNDLVLDEPVRVTIAKKPVTFTGNSATYTYNGTERSVSGWSHVGKIDGHVAEVSATATGTAAGTHTGTITAKDQVVIKAGETDVTSNYNITTIPGKLTIRSLKVTDDGTGTGNGIQVNENGKPVDDKGNELEKQPDGSYKDQNNQPAQPVSAITATGSDGDNAPTYDGQPHAPTLVDNTIKDTDGKPKTLIEGTDYDVTYYNADDVNPDGTIKPGAKPVTPEEAGNKVAVIALKGDYDGTVVVPADIKKADSSVAPDAQPAEGLEYNDELQRLLATLPKAEGGKLLYSVDGGSWTEEAPKAKDATEHSVKYMVVGDKNHNDFGPQELKVPIIPQEPVLTDDDKPTAHEGMSYNGTPQPLVEPPVNTPVEKNNPGKTNNMPKGVTGVQYQVSTDGGQTWSDPSDTVPTATDAGDYVVRTTYTVDDNHSAPDPVDTQVTIAPCQVPDATTEGGIAPGLDSDGDPVDEDDNKIAKGEDGKYYPPATTGDNQLVRDDKGSLVPDTTKDPVTPKPSVMVVGVGDSDDSDHTQGEMSSLKTVDPALAEEVANSVKPVYDAQAHEPAAYDNTKLKETHDSAGARLVEGKDYDIVYYNASDIDEAGKPKDGATPLDTTNPDADNYAFDAGDKVAVITFKGNYAGTLTAPVKIDKREFRVLTASASKTYDGTPLTASNVQVWVDGSEYTDENGTLQQVPANAGLVAGQMVEVSVTGSQTAAGQSENKYQIRFKGDKEPTQESGIGAQALAWLGAMLPVRLAIASSANGLAEGTEPTAKRDNYNEVTASGTLTVQAADMSDQTGPTGSGKPITVNPTPGAEDTDENGNPSYTGKPLAGPELVDNTIKDANGNPKKLVEGVDYDVTYYDENGNVATNPTDAGTYTMKITYKGDYQGEYATKVTVAKAKLTVSTPSATKTYDGRALTKTTGASLKGFVNDETATLKVTGRQTQVGSSKNRYQIAWDGTAKETNYTVASEKLGTLKVTPAANTSTTRTTSSGTSGTSYSSGSTGTTVPKTGDNTALWMAPVAAVAGGIVLLVAGRSRRRESAKERTH